MTVTSEKYADAKTVESQAVDWLIARDEPQSWSNEKQMEFEAWLSQSPAHQTAFWRVEASWLRTELFGDLRPFGFGLHRGPRRGRSRLSNFRIAAVMGLFTVLGVSGATYFRQPEAQTFATAVGGHKVITLFDGSQIELNTDTVVQVGGGANQRTVRLVRGEAYFQVHHDAEHVFSVSAAGHRVTDLGTKFVMRARGDHLEVTLLEGKASLEPEDAGQGEPLILKPGDVALATGRSVSLERRVQRELIEDIAWRKGIIVFDNTSLSDAAAEFNRYNARKIVLSGVNGARFKLNGAIRTNDREEFVRLARNMFALHVEEYADRTIIRQ